MIRLEELNEVTDFISREDAVMLSVFLFNMERYWKSHEVLESVWKDSKGQDKKSFKWVDSSRCGICPLPKRRKYNFFLHPKSLFGKVQRLFRIFLRYKYGIIVKGYQQYNTYQKPIYYQNTSEIIFTKRWGRDSNPYIFAICIFESAGERMAALPPHQLFILH